MITAERLREILDYCPETGVFHWNISPSRNTKRGSISGTKSKKDGYIRIKINCQSYLAHRLAWLHFYGRFPAGCIDHIDCNRSNNAINNLRDVTPEINSQNLKTSSSKTANPYLGVSKIGDKFQAQIRINKKLKYIGLFETAAAAHEAYLREKRIHHKGCTI
jgi:hypothetical protein